VVLVGMTASSVKDYLTTPIPADTPQRRDPERLKPQSVPWFGVDIHAAAVDQLLRMALKGDRPTRFWPDWGEALWVLLWALLGGGLGLWFRSPWKLLPCALLGAGLLFLIVALAFRADWWLPFVPSLGAWTLAAFAVTSYVTYLERADRQVVMRLFADHVSPEVAQTLWDNRQLFLEGGKIRSREITATVLFTDLAGFSTISEKMTAAQVMTWLNELMDALTDCVRANGGYVSKYIGDSVMAVFGAPVPSQTEAEFRGDAQNAVRCALAMRRALAGLNRRWREQGMSAVGMRVGVCTGPLIAGSLGKASTAQSEGRLEYTVIGDTVNTASRLESFDKDVADDDIAADNCRILIGQSTLELLEGRFRTRQIGTEPLKGKDERVVVHGVIGEAPQSPPGAAVNIATPAPPEQVNR
jgi:adenylate cyclase